MKKKKIIRIKKNTTFFKDMTAYNQFKEKFHNTSEKINTPTLFNFSEEQVQRNTGTLPQIDVKIKCPECKNGKMLRAYQEHEGFFTVVSKIFGSSNKKYVGWLCQNKRCQHYIPRKEIYKMWGYEYKQGVNLEQ